MNYAAILVFAEAEEAIFVREYHTLTLLPFIKPHDGTLWWSITTVIFKLIFVIHQLQLTSSIYKKQEFYLSEFCHCHKEDISHGMVLQVHKWNVDGKDSKQMCAFTHTLTKNTRFDSGKIVKSVEHW